MVRREFRGAVFSFPLSKYSSPTKGEVLRSSGGVCLYSVLPRPPQVGGWHLPCFSAGDRVARFLYHFWWQKWRKSHAPHLWRERETKSLKQTPLAGKVFTVFVLEGGFVDWCGAILKTILCQISRPLRGRNAVAL